MQNQNNKLKDLKKLVDNIRMAAALKLQNDLTTNNHFMMMYMDSPPESVKQMGEDFAKIDAEEKLMTYLMQANAKIEAYSKKVYMYNSVSSELGDLLKLVNGENDETKTVKTVS